MKFESVSSLLTMFNIIKYPLTYHTSSINKHVYCRVLLKLYDKVVNFESLLPGGMVCIGLVVLDTVTVSLLVQTMFH